MTGLEERLQALEDERAILQTLYAYGHSIDYGLEEEFVRRWSEWAEWSHREGLAEVALLLRDGEDPRSFVSFGPWESVAAIAGWRALSGYQERLDLLRRVVESFEPRTLEIVARR